MNKPLHTPRARSGGRWLVSLLLLVTTAAELHAAGGISGKVQDGQGNPAAGLTVRFTPEGKTGVAQTVETRKKGQFFRNGLPPGRYTIDLVDSELFVTYVEYLSKNDVGLVLAQGRLDGHPREGVAGVPLSNVHEIQLTLVVAARGSAEENRRELAFALPALSTVAALYNAGDYEQAAGEAQRILIESPELGEAHYVRGVALEKLGRHADAETSLRSAARQIPDYPRIWATLGDVALNLAGELASGGAEEAARQAAGRAAEALEQAVAREPDSLPLLSNLAAALEQTAATERLVPVLERIVAGDGENLQARLRLAGLYSARGEQPRAMELLRGIPATEKRAAITLYNVAVRLNDEGDAAGALLVARRSAEIDPQLSHPRRLLAQLLLAQGDHAGAAEAVRAFLELAPDDPEAETYRGILQQLEQP